LRSFQETAYTRAGDRGLGPPLVRRRPYCDPRFMPSPRPAGAWPPGRAIYLASWPSRVAARALRGSWAPNRKTAHAPPHFRSKGSRSEDGSRVTTFSSKGVAGRRPQGPAVGPWPTGHLHFHCAEVL